MTLTTHAIAGAAVATLMPAHPVIGFFAGFASHFVLDAIPHWDYQPQSIIDHADKTKLEIAHGARFYKDIAKVLLDVALGFAFAFLLFGRSGASAPLAAFAGAFGALCPDGIQFLYFKFKQLRVAPMNALQKFHAAIQEDRRLQGHPWPGVTIQILLIGVMAWAHWVVTTVFWTR